MNPVDTSRRMRTALFGDRSMILIEGPPGSSPYGANGMRTKPPLSVLILQDFSPLFRGAQTLAHGPGVSPSPAQLAPRFNAPADTRCPGSSGNRIPRRAPASGCPATPCTPPGSRSATCCSPRGIAPRAGGGAATGADGDAGGASRGPGSASSMMSAHTRRTSLPN
jgi:hypothetical protein